MATSVSPSIPTESSTAAPTGGFSTWFKNIGDWLKSLSPLGATQYDTGRIDGNIYTPWVGTVVARRIGKMVEVKFDLTGGSVGAGAYNVFAALPSGIPGPAPSPGMGRGAGISQGASVHCYVQTSGAIGFLNDTTATRSTIAGSIIYMVD